MNGNQSKISLSREASQTLLRVLIQPDRECLKKRDDFLKGTENWTITEEDGWITVDIPEWNANVIDSSINAIHPLI